jgi:ribonuclease PH
MMCGRLRQTLHLPTRKERSIVRADGRMPGETRPLEIRRDYTCYAEGSVLIQAGNTRVICTAMVENRVPPHCLAPNRGWITAEYCMLPSANPQRRSLHGPPNGRVQEIQRLIGRSLRAAVDLYQLAGRTIWLDCDVIQADGGTRTASITGAFVALVDALDKLKEAGKIEVVPLVQGIAAVSVGVVDGQAMVDLSADEDRAASVDMNVVMTHDRRLIELQGTAEKQPFARDQHEEMLNLAQASIEAIKAAQISALGGRLSL